MTTYTTESMDREYTERVYSEDPKTQERFKEALTERWTLETTNSTVYNADDIRALWLLAHRLACELRIKEGASKWAPPNPPSKLIISYYTRTSDDKAVKSEDRKKKGGITRSKYGNIRYQGSKYRNGSYTGVRLGIVRPSKLYDSPLQQMAAVADDVMHLPQREIAQIVEVMREYYSVWFGQDPDKSWDLLLGAKIRYGDRAKRGSRKDASLRAKNARVASIRARYRKCRDAIDFANEMIKTNEAKQEALRVTYNEVADSLDIPEYDRWL